MRAIVICLTVLALASCRVQNRLEAIRQSVTVDASYPAAAEAGRAIRVDFRIRGRSGERVEVCLTGALGVRAFDMDGHGFTNVPEGGPLFCKTPVTLSETQSLDLSTEFAFPETLKPGPVMMQLGSYLTSREECHGPVGCSYVWVQAPLHELQLTRAPAL